VSETKSPLARLVLFMICLSVAGIFVSGVYTFTAGPQQQSVTAPENSADSPQFEHCMDVCDSRYDSRTHEGSEQLRNCQQTCYEKYGS
jgi:hypothetical protein